MRQTGRVGCAHRRQGTRGTQRKHLRSGFPAGTIMLRIDQADKAVLVMTEREEIATPDEAGLAMTGRRDFIGEGAASLPTLGRRGTRRKRLRCASPALLDHFRSSHHAQVRPVVTFYNLLYCDHRIVKSDRGGPGYVTGHNPCHALDLLAGNTYLPLAVRSPAGRDPQFHDPLRRNGRLDGGENKSHAQNEPHDQQGLSLHGNPPYLLFRFVLSHLHPDRNTSKDN